MAPFYDSFFSYRDHLFDIEIYQIHLKGLMSMIAFIKIYEKEVNHMDIVAYAKAAVEKKSQELKKCDNINCYQFCDQSARTKVFRIWKCLVC